jgi:hypothetical protein
VTDGRLQPASGRTTGYRCPDSLEKSEAGRTY